ncbi:MAG: ABC transporter ATP-binding protein [Planctomycetes bacterium]|nr:ABC transporter ATP-binding protein [Planctomycetota bacterium]
MSVLVEARDLGRFYGDVVGVSDVSLTIGPGVVGLLGPNGAGKSTFLKLLVGELRPSRGSIRVLGEDPFANRHLFARLGFCPQQDAMYGEMTGLEFVTFLVRLSGFSLADARARAERALARVDLSSARDRKTRGYSKGMRQRVKIAQAIAHDPELVVLDEPLTGLDPIARLDTLKLFHELIAQGVSIVLSSHVLHEVEALTQDIVLLHRGRLLAQGGIREVRGLLSAHPRRVVIRAREPRRLGRALLGVPGVSGVRLESEDRLFLETTDLPRLESDLPRVAAEEKAGIQSYETLDAGLEAIFDYLVETSA